MSMDNSLHIDRDTRITWRGTNETFWVTLEQGGSSTTIFVDSADSAKRLGGTLWVIRERLHANMVNEEQAGISAERVF